MIFSYYNYQIKRKVTLRKLKLISFVIRTHKTHYTCNKQGLSKNDVVNRVFVILIGFICTSCMYNVARKQSFFILLFKKKNIQKCFENKSSKFKS